MAYHIQFTNQLRQIFQDTDRSIWLNKSFFEDDLLLITQNRQVKNWLLQQAGKHFGIAPFLSHQCQLSEQAIRNLLPQMAGIEEHFNFTKHFNQDKKQILFLPDLRMVVYKYLEMKIQAKDPLFTPVSDYLMGHTDHDTKKDFIQSSRLFAVASSVSTLLEEYTARYEHLMEAWGKDELFTEDNRSEKWQQRLWYDLFGKSDAQFALPSDILRDVLKEKRSYLGKIRKIIIVGTPFLTTLTHQFFMHLAKDIDVHIIVYSAVEPRLLHESPTFFDKQYAGALWEYFTEVMEHQWEYHIEMKPSEPTSALQQIQQGITFHQMPDVEHIFVDYSMRLIACAEPMREVETLKDYILHALASDPSLTLDEICIVMSDQALYTPYLNLVFHKSFSDNYIQLYFDDLLADARLPIAYQAILQLLQLATSRFKRSEIFELLRNEAIYANLDFSDQERMIWLQFCEEQHVAWGFDEDHKATEVGGSSSYFSWVEAFEAYLEQAIYGDSDEHTTFRPVQAAMIGKFIYFVHRLYDNFHDLTHKNLTIEDWITHLEPRLAHFLPGSEAKSGRINLFRSLNEISAALNNLEYFNIHYGDNKIPFIIVLQLIKEAMDREVERSLQLQNRRGILCAPIAALRLIPFRIVAFLGMDEEKYPKKEQQNSAGYNLGELFTQTFIMSQSNNERASFLEMFLAISEQVWFFYQSSHRQDGQILEPSSVLYDLFQEANISLDGMASYPLLVKTPLHPFHHSWFQEVFPFTYNSKYFDHAKAFYHPQQREKKDGLTFSLDANKNRMSSLDLDDLVHFIWDPFSHAIEYHLGKIYHKRQEDNDEEAYTLKKSFASDLLYTALERLLSEAPSDNVLEQIWQEEITSGRVKETPYLARHYQQYQRLGKLMMHHVKDTLPKQRLEKRVLTEKYLFSMETYDTAIDNIEATLQETYRTEENPHLMIQYIVNSYIQKHDDTELGYFWRERIKEKLLNSLWSHEGKQERLVVSVGEFKKSKENDHIIDFTFHSSDPENLLRQSDIQKLLLFYQKNLVNPLFMTSTMWLDLKKNVEKDPNKMLGDAYKDVRKKAISSDERYTGKGILVEKIEYFQLDEEKIASRELYTEETELLEFLWQHFFKY